MDTRYDRTTGGVIFPQSLNFLDHKKLIRLEIKPPTFHSIQSNYYFVDIVRLLPDLKS